MSRYQDSEDLQRQQQVDDEASEHRYFLDNDPFYQHMIDEQEADRLNELENINDRSKPF